MIRIRILNGPEVAEQLRMRGKSIRAALEKALLAAGLKLQGYVQIEKLSGQVLHQRSGRLSGSIHAHGPQSMSGFLREQVGTNVEYARIHEYGATITRMLNTAWGRPLKSPHDVTYHYPERSFLRSSLRENAQDIRERLREAVRQGVLTGVKP